MQGLGHNRACAVQGLEGQLTTYKAHLGAPHPCYRCLFPGEPPPDLIPTCAQGGVLGPAVGRCHYEVGNEVITALRADGSVTDVWARRTQILCLEGRLSEASDLARRAIEANPRCADAWYQLGVAQNHHPRPAPDRKLCDRPAPHRVSRAGH